MANLVQSNATFNTNGYASDIVGFNGPFSKGVNISPYCTFFYVPTPADNVFVAAPQVITAGVPIVLNAINISTTQFQGVYPLQLDWQRGLNIIPSNGVATDIATTVTTTGWDFYNTPLTANTLIPIGTVSGQEASTVDKMFYRIASITFSAFPYNNPTQTTSVGIGRRLGLPFYLNNLASVDSYYWADATRPYTSPYYDNASPALANTVRITAGFPWRSNPAGAIANTANNNDALGFVDLPSDPDGVKVLKVKYYVYGADPYLYAQLQNEVNGSLPKNVTAKILVNVQRNASNTKWVLPYLVKQDEVAPQMPGDAAFLASYNTLLLS